MANSGRLRRRKPILPCCARHWWRLICNLQKPSRVTTRSQNQKGYTRPYMHLHKCMTHTAWRTKVSSWALTIGEVLSTISSSYAPASSHRFNGIGEVKTVEPFSVFSPHRFSTCSATEAFGNVLCKQASPFPHPKKWTSNHHCSHFVHHCNRHGFVLGRAGTEVPPCQFPRTQRKTSRILQTHNLLQHPFPAIYIAIHIFCHVLS